MLSLGFSHQISSSEFHTVTNLSSLINIVEQYLKKFDFDGITFQPYGYEAPVNFGNADHPPPSKGVSVKPKQQQK